MRAEARCFKSRSDETRLKILWLLSGTEELCVCDIIDVLGITQSKASRHRRYIYHLGWVTDRRDGLWMYDRASRQPEREAAQTPGGNVGASARNPGAAGATGTLPGDQTALPVRQEAERRPERVATTAS